jgi:hypothetical protein
MHWARFGNTSANDLQKILVSAVPSKATFITAQGEMNLKEVTTTGKNQKQSGRLIHDYKPRFLEVFGL